MTLGICKRCGRGALKKKQLCDKCLSRCATCKKRPRAYHSSYCVECRAADKQRRKGPKLCKCGVALAKGRGIRLCDACKVLCAKCGERPRRKNGSPWCNACIMKYNTDYTTKLKDDPDYVEKQRLRYRVRYNIRAGKIQREPCLVCGKEPGHIFVRRVKLSKELVYFFLCQEHHADFSGRQGAGHKPWIDNARVGARCR